MAGRKPMRKGDNTTPKSRIQAHLDTKDLEVNDEDLYEEYDDGSHPGKGDEDAYAYSVSVEERRLTPPTTASCRPCLPISNKRSSDWTADA